MNFRFRIFLSLGVALSLHVPAGAEDVPEGFTPLFNGKDLSGWFGRKTEDPVKLKEMTAEELKAHKKSTLEDIHAHWTVVDGVLHNDGKGLYLTTEKDYADFELRLEYKTVPLADSGIYLRGVPQVQIWDSTEEKKFKLGADKGSGGLWNNKDLPGKDPLVLADKPFGEWNQMSITMVSEYVTVYLNGKLVVDHAKMRNYFKPREPIYESGPIQLQTHGGEISWRNIYIREYSEMEAKAYLALKGE